MSLNSLRNTFHTAGLGKWLLGIVTVAMLITTFTGIGSMLSGTKVSPQNTDTSRDPNATVATINGSPVTRADWNHVYSAERQEMQMYSQQQTPNTVQLMSMRQDAVSQLIQQMERVQIAKSVGVTATDQDLRNARQQQLVGLRTQLGLSATASEDQVNQALQKYGETLDEVMPPTESLTDQIVLQKYQFAMTKSNPADDAAVKQYFAKVRTRHILISNKSRPDAQAKQQAQQLIDKIKAGADFAALAKQYSDDPGTKNKGGDDGFITTTTQYVPEFLNAALALKPGQTTPEPVLAPQFGYFIIQATAAEDGTPKDYDKKKAQYQQQVSDYLTEQKENAAFTAFQSTAKVVFTDPLLRAYYNLHQPNPAQNAASIHADLQKALASADFSTKAEIYAAMAQIDVMSKDTKSEIADLNSALANSDDPILRVALAQAYITNKDNTNAVAQLQQASSHSYDISLHTQIQTLYKQLNQPQLAEQEAKLISDYAARQKAAGGVPGMPGVSAVPMPASSGVPPTPSAPAVTTVPAPKTAAAH